jgi:hypothetical protein
MSDSPLRELDRLEALAELREILSAIKQPSGILRYPSEMIGDRPAAEVARDIAESIQPGTVLAFAVGSQWDYQPVAGIQPAALSRLAWLLGLSPSERAFVSDGLDKPRDPTSLMALADYLRDMGRDAEADQLKGK